MLNGNSTRLALITAAFTLASTSVFAGPAEEATKTLTQWAQAFNAGDANAVSALYIPEATVHSTVGANLTDTPAAISSYFTAAAKGKIRVKLLGEPAATVLNGNDVALAGYYEFAGTRANGEAFVTEARYSFVIVERDGNLRIAHHHSSPRPKQN
jgi:uncharacterized protein (TIGR02246 family)